MRLGKRGQLGDAILWSIRFIVFAIAVYFVVSTVKSVIPDLADTVGTEYEILAKRILYSQSGISYEDSNGRIYPGVIDINKLEQETLNNFIEGKRSFAVKVKIKTINNEKIFNKESEKEIFNDPDKFHDLKALAWAKQINLKSYPEYVVARDDKGNLYPATLNLEIVFKDEI